MADKVSAATLAAAQQLSQSGNALESRSACGRLAASYNYDRSIDIFEIKIDTVDILLAILSNY